VTPQTTGEIESLRSLAYAVLRRDPNARDAHLRLFEVEQMLGQPQAAIGHLRMALQASRIVTLPAKQTATRSVLAITRVAPWEANTPLELIVDDQHTTLHRYYIDDNDTELVMPPDMPAFDVLFNTIAESDKARHALRLARDFATHVGCEPINAPEAVANIGRSGVAALFANSSTILAPAIERATREPLLDLTLDAPLIIRPVGSQAGIGLARVDDNEELRDYLEERPEADFFIMPFVDSSSEIDHQFRKYRIMFVAGKAYPCHLAISPRWMIHYYNAAMADHQWMRDEEARFIGNMDGVFTGILAEALAEIAAAIPLDYFGIDCTIAPDGRLLLFEADAAMLVHGSDPPELYPYKRAGFERIKAALESMIASRMSA
jgi:hypothetical protein